MVTSVSNKVAGSVFKANVNVIPRSNLSTHIKDDRVATVTVNSEM
jgi:hypothetical protein